MILRLALLGAGRIGKIHAKAIQNNPDAVLAVVTDALPAAAQDLASEYGVEVRDMKTIADATDIDAVVICTPTNTHADLIEIFACAGKAIFCEKPIDLSLARVKSCLAVVEDKKATLMIGFNRRFDPHFQGAQNAIATGQIGDVEQVVITSRDPVLPPYDYITVSGGIFRDMTIHDFDMARFMLGEEINTVQAAASALIDPKIGELGDFDTASLILTTTTGKQAIISNSRRATYGYDQRVEVHGALGSVTVKNEHPLQVEVATAAGYTRTPLHDFFMTRYFASYTSEIAAFVAAVKDGAPTHPAGRDGMISLALAEAAILSVKEGRTVVMSEVFG